MYLDIFLFCSVCSWSYLHSIYISLVSTHTHADTHSHTLTFTSGMTVKLCVHSFWYQLISLIHFLHAVEVGDSFTWASNSSRRFLAAPFCISFVSFSQATETVVALCKQRVEYRQLLSLLCELWVFFFRFSGMGLGTYWMFECACPNAQPSGHSDLDIDNASSYPSTHLLLLLFFFLVASHRQPFFIRISSCVWLGVNRWTASWAFGWPANSSQAQLSSVRFVLSVLQFHILIDHWHLQHICCACLFVVVIVVDSHSFLLHFCKHTHT